MGGWPRIKVDQVRIDRLVDAEQVVRCERPAQRARRALSGAELDRQTQVDEGERRLPDPGTAPPLRDGSLDESHVGALGFEPAVHDTRPSKLWLARAIGRERLAGQ